MKADDKELVLPPDSLENPEKIPKIEVYSHKVLKASKKPWFTGCLGIAIATLALILSLAVFVAFLGYIGMLPQTVEDSDIFGKIDEHDRRLSDLEKNRICRLPKDSGNCLDYILRWYFDTEKAKCSQFVYSGCMGNANNFGTENECQSNCFSWGDDVLIPPGLEEEEGNFCSEEPDAGPCKASKPRFYFDENDKSCKTFLYGGCKGNRNNFLTEKDCQNACNKDQSISPRVDDDDICQLRPETGTCRASLEKFYFNSQSGECEIFEYGGCDGNQNNFDSKENCEKRCKMNRNSKNDDENVCNLPAEMGPCRATIPRFYFNAESGKCELFMFGGCRGNGNNFDSEQSCYEKCLKM